MRLLILGGTGFVGRHVAELALDRGHDVTLFVRGRSGSGALPNCARIIGDRRGDLGTLGCGRWDAVLDTSGYRPDDVRRSASRLRNACELYAFVSTLDVYADHSMAGLSEGAELHPFVDISGPDRYGVRKAQCEREVTRAFGDRALVVRPGLIVGPHDKTDRFSYWPVRFALGGDVLIPGPPARPVQIIDARDHAEFLLVQIERGMAGTYNVASPPGRLTMGGLVSACREAAGAGAPFWVDPARLALYGVRPWTELPLWFGDDDRRAGSMQVSTSRAEAAGLRCRPLIETVSDTLAWKRTQGPLGRCGDQLPALKERMLLLIASEEGWVS